MSPESHFLPVILARFIPIGVMLTSKIVCPELELDNLLLTCRKFGGLLSVVSKDIALSVDLIESILEASIFQLCQSRGGRFDGVWLAFWLILLISTSVTNYSTIF